MKSFNHQANALWMMKLKPFMQLSYGNTTDDK